MIQIGICDDEPILLDSLYTFTGQCLAEDQIFATISKFHQSMDLLYEIQDGAIFDLLLLDIEMPRLNGMELAGKIRNYLPQALIIFITSYTQYALDAYELSVFRYISKASMEEKLPHALKDAAKMIRLQRDRSYLIQSQNRLQRIPYRNILYIYHEAKNAVLVTDLQEEALLSFKTRKTLQQVYEELDAGEFLFIDRGCIVNLSHVVSLRGSDCILKDGTRLAVSQARMQPLKEQMLSFWKQHI